MKLTNLYKYFWSFGLTLELITAFIWTLIIVFWEWVVNPIGIFHSQSGINLHFVYDTALSWFVPILIYVTIFGAVEHLLFSGFREFYRHRSKL